MASPSTVRVGVVLPHSYYGESEWQNAERAIAYADEAASKGAQLVLYPEGYLPVQIFPSAYSASSECPWRPR